MELIVISHPDSWENEAQTVTKLLEAGLERFHLRKPEWSEEAIRAQLERILGHREFHATEKMRDFLRFVVAPDAQLSVMEIRWGIIPDMGISVVAPSVIARDQLKLMAMTGDRVAGEKALQLGLVTQTEAEPETQALVDRFVEAYNAGDVEGLGALLHPNFERLITREAIAEPQPLETVLTLYEVDAALHMEISVACRATPSARGSPSLPGPRGGGRR